MSQQPQGRIRIDYKSHETPSKEELEIRLKNAFERPVMAQIHNYYFESLNLVGEDIFKNAVLQIKGPKNSMVQARLIYNPDAPENNWNERNLVTLELYGKPKEVDSLGSSLNRFLITEISKRCSYIPN